MVSWLLGAGWGALAAWPVVRAAQRRHLVSRVSAIRHVRAEVPEPWFWGRPRERSGERARQVALAALGSLGPLGRVVDGVHARLGARRRDREMLREVPVVVDLLAVAVGAGCTTFLAAGVAAEWAPPRSAARFGDAVRACDLGERVVDALARVGTHPRLVPVADALIAAERLGTPVAPALERLGAASRAEARRRAEANARVVPVRLLFPLVFLVLPAFALLTVVPALLGGLARV